MSLTKVQEARIRQEERIRKTMQDIDNQLTGLELELIIAAVRANKWVVTEATNGFSIPMNPGIPMNPDVQASILRKLEARRA